MQASLSTGKRMEMFNQATAEILDYLFMEFPHPVPLRPDQLAPSQDGETLCTYAGTITFLHNEGYIRFGSRVASDVFYEVMLTGKGLALLQATPAALNTAPTFAQGFRQALADGSIEVIKGLVVDFLKQTIGLTSPSNT